MKHIGLPVSKGDDKSSVPRKRWLGLLSIEVSIFSHHPLMVCGNLGSSLLCLDKQSLGGHSLLSPKKTRLVTIARMTWIVFGFSMNIEGHWFGMGFVVLLVLGMFTCKYRIGVRRIRDSTRTCLFVLRVLYRILSLNEENKHSMLALEFYKGKGSKLCAEPLNISMDINEI